MSSIPRDRIYSCLSTSMSSYSPSSPLNIPFKFRRKSSSASTSVLGDAAPSSLLSSSPLLTPLHPTRRYECTEWQANDCLDDLDGIIYDPRDRAEDVNCPWSRHARPADPPPRIHWPLPSLMSKFTAHTPHSDAPLSYSPSLFSSAPQTTYIYPQGDCAIADDCEEYDLESMDIHIRETYFATSAERGRWLSSPIASRVRPQAIPPLPMRGHSSPLKTLTDASPPKERLRRRKRSCSADKQISAASLKDHDEDVWCLSSLPPSSPLTSPMSNLSFLGDECGDDSVGVPLPNSDDCHSSTGTPELSTSSTTCTSPVECGRAPTPHEAPIIVPALRPTDSPGRLSDSVASHQTSPRLRSSRSPKRIEINIHACGVTGSELDDTLSPLSEIELDLREPEPLKLPLSDTMNRPHPRQGTDSPGVTVDTVLSRDGPSCVQPLSMNSNHQPLGVSLDTVGGSSFNTKAKKRKESVAGNRGARRTKKRAVIQSRNSTSDTKDSRGVEGHTFTHSEPPSKKSKLSCCGDGPKSRGAKSFLRHGRIPKAKQPFQSSSRPVVEGCSSESANWCDKKTSNLLCRAEQQPSAPGSPTTLVTTGAVDPEFHVSLTGMLVEALATSRATSMDSAALYLVLAQAHPYLTAQRSKEELLIDIVAVLEAGRARCGMFEKVDSSCEGTQHKALDGRWFYVPERDEDSERASLISAIMPRQKRNETKKYKQYYYRPLDKISRWDPEDAP